MSSFSRKKVYGSEVLNYRTSGFLGRLLHTLAGYATAMPKDSNNRPEIESPRPHYHTSKIENQEQKPQSSSASNPLSAEKTVREGYETINVKGNEKRSIPEHSTPAKVENTNKESFLPTMYDVFISYATEDKERVAKPRVSKSAFVR
jgi:hypothetical protein